MNNLTIEKSDTGFSSFNEDNVYPGHKELIQLKITSEANNITDTFFNIVYEGTNTFPNDMIEFDIYESDEAIDGTEASEAFKCTKKSEELSSGNYKLYEDCQLDEKLQADLSKKHLLQNTKLKLNSDKVILNGIHPFVITGTAQKRTMYYYVVVKYKDTGSSQNETDQGKKLNGTINVEIAARDNEAIKDDEDHITKKAGE